MTPAGGEKRFRRRLLPERIYMTNLDDIISFLAAKGVKSLHIEMYEPSKACACATRQPVQVVTDPTPKVEIERIEPPYEELHLSAREARSVLKDVAAVVIPPVQPSEQAEAEASVEELLLQAHDVHEKATAEQPAPVTPPNIPPVAEKTPEAKAEPKAEKKPLSGKKAYETFTALITDDDGTVTKEQRAALIEKMGLDDLLRVNNDFSLGLDTDKPVDEIRKDVIDCF